MVGSFWKKSFPIDAAWLALAVSGSRQHVD
jgi:hypothetical protein